MNQNQKINRAQLKIARKDFDNRLSTILQDHCLKPNNKQLALSLVGVAKLLKEKLVLIEYGAGMGKSRIALVIGMLLGPVSSQIRYCFPNKSLKDRDQERYATLVSSSEYYTLEEMP